jgi:hypothetical protein
MFLLTACAFLPIKVTAAYMIFDWIQQEVADLKKSLGKNDGKEISDMGPCQFGSLHM